MKPRMLLRTGTKSLACVFALACAFCGDEASPNFREDLAAASVPVAGVLPYFKGRVMDPFWPANAAERADLRKLDNFVLIAHDARKFDDSRLAGKYSLVTFFFARCNGICPLITANMKKLSAKIARQSDMQWLSITVNPDEDDAAAIDEFRRNHDIAQTNWIFLTGHRGTIYELARSQFGADVQTVNGRDSLNDFVHTENVFLLDREGYLRGVYRARGMGDLDRLLTDLATLREHDRQQADSRSARTLESAPTVENSMTL